MRPALLGSEHLVAAGEKKLDAKVDGILGEEIWGGLLGASQKELAAGPGSIGRFYRYAVNGKIGGHVVRNEKFVCPERF